MKGQRGWAAPLTQCLACIAGSLLALLAALNMTLFREGYYINRLEKSTCLQAITENILQAGQTVAQTAGLRQDILDSLVTQEDVQVAVLRRADEIWHGATTQPDSPYSDVVAYLQDTVSKETGEMWDDTDVNLYTSIRAVCDDMWRSNAVPPMANVLNLLMQYRRVAAPLTIVLVAVLLGCLWLQVPLSRNWRGLFGALFAIGAGILVASVLGMIAVQLSGWQGWMDAADPAYELYKSWFGGFPPVLAACGCGLAGLVWLADLLPYTMMMRTEAARRKKARAAARNQ